MPPTTRTYLRNYDASDTTSIAYGNFSGPFADLSDLGWEAPSMTRFKCWKDTKLDVYYYVGDTPQEPVYTVCAVWEAIVPYIVTDEELTSVADAIREKGGTSAQLSWPTEYIEAIGDIQTGSGSSGWIDITDQLSLSRELTSKEEVLFLRNGSDMLFLYAVDSNYGAITVTAPFYMVRNRSFRTGGTQGSYSMDAQFSNSLRISNGSGDIHYGFASDVMAYRIYNYLSSDSDTYLQFSPPGDTVTVSLPYEEDYAVYAYARDSGTIIQAALADGTEMEFVMPEEAIEIGIDTADNVGAMM